MASLAAAILAISLLAATDTVPKKERVFDPAGLDVNTLTTLANRGSIVIVDTNEKGKPKLVTAGTVVDAPPSVVYSVLTDYASFKDFMPQVEECTPGKVREDGMRDVKFKLKFKFSIVSQNIEYKARFEYTENEKIVFEYVDGDIKDGGGSYVLVPHEGGKKTLMFYSVISDLNSMGYFTRKLLSEQPQMEPAMHVSTASVVSTAVKKRAEAQHAKLQKVSGVRP